MTTQVLRETTTVVLAGGGASGLTAATLLRKSGIDCVVLERRPRDYVEQRQRAGALEYRAVRMFQDWGLSSVLGSFRPMALWRSASMASRSLSGGIGVRGAADRS